MITNLVIEILTMPLYLALALIPKLEFTVPTDLATQFAKLLNQLAYVLPMGDILAMLAIMITVANFQILWSFLLRVWDALPFT